MPERRLATVGHSPAVGDNHDRPDGLPIARPQRDVVSTLSARLADVSALPRTQHGYAVNAWCEKYKPGAPVRIRCVYLLHGKNDWQDGTVVRLSEDHYGPVVVVDVDGLVMNVCAPENIRTAKKRLRVRTGV